VIVSPGSTLYLSHPQFEVPGQVLSRHPPAKTKRGKKKKKKMTQKSVESIFLFNILKFLIFNFWAFPKKKIPNFRTKVKQSSNLLFLFYNHYSLFTSFTVTFLGAIKMIFTFFLRSIKSKLSSLSSFFKFTVNPIQRRIFKLK